MAMRVMTVEIGQQPTEAQIRELEAAALRPPVLDPECPPLSEAALAEFAAQAREMRRLMPHPPRNADEMRAYAAIGDDVRRRMRRSGSPA